MSEQQQWQFLRAAEWLALFSGVLYFFGITANGAMDLAMGLNFGISDPDFPRAVAIGFTSLFMAPSIRPVLAALLYAPSLVYVVLLLLRSKWWFARRACRSTAILLLWIGWFVSSHAILAGMAGQQYVRQELQDVQTWFSGSQREVHHPFVRASYLPSPSAAPVEIEGFELARSSTHLILHCRDGVAVIPERLVCRVTSSRPSRPTGSSHQMPGASQPNKLLQWLAVARHCRGSEGSVRTTATTDHGVIHVSENS